jgi:hypothetical protein
MTPLQIKQSLRRQRMLEKMGEMLVKSRASKVPLSQVDLLPEEDRHLAGKKKRVAVLPKILPAFLVRKSTKWWTILKLKLLARSLKVASSSFWSLRRMELRMRVTRFLKRSTPKPTRAAWLTRPSFLRRRKNILAESPSVSGENISETNTFSPMREPRRYTSQITCSGIGRASVPAEK